jgi:hypothetical protein
MAAMERSGGEVVELVGRRIGDDGEDTRKEKAGLGSWLSEC